MFGKKEALELEQNKYYRIEAEEYLNKPEKTEGLLNKAIKKANQRKGNLGEAWEKLQLLIEMIKAYSKGDYKNISNATILTCFGAILYFISPIDLVPDFIVGLGIMDDAAVIGYTIKKLGTEIEEFKKWKKSSQVAKENPFD
ncbi:YkvA family protein [Neobacillus drentensis]|uniref:YkvA family protein n=1 Tax=Neobacillus drentensis TaxID=220684 RepID=UPI002FFFB0CF